MSMYLDPEHESARTRTFERRQFLIYETVTTTQDGVGDAEDAAAQAAAAFPEVDLDERLTWREWNLRAG